MSSSSGREVQLVCVAQSPLESVGDGVLLYRDVVSVEAGVDIRVPRRDGGDPVGRFITDSQENGREFRRVRLHSGAGNDAER